MRNRRQRGAGCQDIVDNEHPRRRAPGGERKCVLDVSCAGRGAQRRLVPFRQPMPDQRSRYGERERSGDLDGLVVAVIIP